MNPNGRKILVVDDNLQFADIMVQILENQGFRASMASNGNMAIEKVSSENPELVLLDLKLPDIPGEEVLKKIKHRFSQSAYGITFFSEPAGQIALKWGLYGLTGKHYVI